MVWQGVLLEESLEDKSLLNLVKIIDTEKDTLEGENKILTFHKIEVSEANKDAFVRTAIQKIKQKFYLHIVKKGVMYVIFRKSMYKFSKGYPELEEAREHGISIGIPKEQMPFEQMIKNPFA